MSAEQTAICIIVCGALGIILAAIITTCIDYKKAERRSQKKDDVLADTSEKLDYTLATEVDKLTRCIALSANSFKDASDAINKLTSYTATSGDGAVLKMQDYMEKKQTPKAKAIARQCPNCGAPLHGNVCEYCDTEIEYQNDNLFMMGSCATPILSMSATATAFMYPEAFPTNYDSFGFKQ